MTGDLSAVSLSVGRKATVHIANIVNGTAYPLCGGRFRVDVSAERSDAAPTCRTCKKRA